ncbi:MAG: metal-dependent hydrolase [Methylococcales bacterium]|nr:metal-dependent hydrolase [Methylococcales bacterium]
MANFKTHLTVAATVSAGAAQAAAVWLDLAWLDVTWLTLVGTVGGLLPDIDADQSVPLRYLFTALALFFTGWLLVISHCQALSRQALLLAGLASFFSFRYLAFWAFQKLTRHRGVFHSLLSAVFFSLLLTLSGYQGLAWTPLFAWLSGLFLGFGFIVHLLLDELYSVDLTNARMKKSFGTAFKLASRQNPLGSLALLLLSGLMWLNAPSAEALVLPGQQVLGLVQHVIEHLSEDLLSWR